MNRIGFIVWILSISTISCSPMSTDLRKEGFRLTQKAFDTFEATPELHEIVTIERVTIHIVGSRQHFNWYRAKIFESGIAGYATSDNEIYVIGKKIGGKTIVNQAVLGHELNHLLNFHDSRIADPHELDRLEFCSLHRFTPARCN